jgi:hypothetical protein
MNGKITIQARDFNANGKSPLRGIAVICEDGEFIGLEWYGNFSSDQQLAKFIKWLSKNCDISLEEAEGEAYNFVQRLQNQRDSAEQQGQEARPKQTTLLDQAPPTLSRPLGLIEGRAYAATWLWAEVRTFDPPNVTREYQQFIVRDDGQRFEPVDLDSLGLQVSLPDNPPENRLWRTKGVKAYCSGQRTDYSELFRRLVSVYDYFLDFSQSFATSRKCASYQPA